MTRKLKYSQAVNEAIDQCMARDPSVYTMGLGVPDPKGVFGTTLGLLEKHGSARVLDMPASENAMTGVALGSALVGMRPILSHQRVDFCLLALDQIANQAANWRYMFGGRHKVPLVIRLIVGRGWGQGPQHSQSLHAWFAHVPGLKVVMPSDPYDAKGLMVSAVEDDNPVIFLEHRWLHERVGHVPEELYRVPLGPPKRVREGTDVTLVAISYMNVEALRAAELLEEEGVSAEVIDLRCLNPLEDAPILESVRKTGALVVLDTAWTRGGFGAEVACRVAEKAFGALKRPPVRIALPDLPTPTSPALSAHYYPRSPQVVAAVRRLLGLEGRPEVAWRGNVPLDVPDVGLYGPF
ncbi:MAG: alpha-ketoacid dehydrogenase subunit beta [Deltaproteobacteria bacterium]|nr:alpha-ketoacid dehydrogenase subunit beta [Deltaproteobacteria bacterium]